MSEIEKYVWFDGIRYTRQKDERYKEQISWMNDANTATLTLTTVFPTDFA